MLASLAACGSNNSKPIDAARAIDAIPDKEFHLLTDAAHWPQWEKPDEVNRRMIEFLTRIANRSGALAQGASR